MHHLSSPPREGASPVHGVIVQHLLQGKGGAPVAYQVILEPGIGQFREFEPPRVHSRIYSWGDFFLCTQIDLRKSRERELETTLDENRRAVGLLNPMRDKN